MMKLAQQLSLMNQSDSHRHTSGFVRRAIFVLSLLVFCLGSVWGQGTEESIVKRVSRSASFVGISEDLKSKDITNSKYARFYLTDAKGNAINPTGKLTVKYDNDVATLCPTPEQGFYIPDMGVNLTADMFYDYSNASSPRPANDASNFNEGTSGGWKLQGGVSIDVKNGVGVSNTPAIELVSNSSNFWDAQFFYTFNEPLKKNVEYTIKFKARCSITGGKLQFQYQNSSDYNKQGGWHEYNQDVNLDWTEFTHTFSLDNNTDPMDRIILNFARVGATYYIDDIEFGIKNGDIIENVFTNADSNVGTQLGGGGLVIGTGGVFRTIYADLTGYKRMVFEGTPGTVLRVLINRQNDTGMVDAQELKATIGEDRKVGLYLNADLPYIHLNAIKIDNGSSGMVSSIKLFKSDTESESTLDLSKLTVQLAAQKKYKLYKVVCLFSETKPTIPSYGEITGETVNQQYTYSFDYNVTTKEKEDYVDWKDGVLTPSVVFSNPDKDWDTSWEELSLGYCMKWSVVDESGIPVGLVQSPTAQSDKWAIDDKAVIRGTDSIDENVWSNFKKRTFYAPTSQTWEDLNGCKIVCEIYANSTDTGKPNARYTFPLRRFLGELQGDNTKKTTLDVKKGVTSLEMELEKVTYANAKYARIWLTTTDGTLVDPTGKLLIEGMVPFTTDGYTDVRYGYYLYRNGDNISLSAIKDILQLPLGTYNQYQVHVALSTGIPKVVGGEIAQEPDYDYVYTLDFTYPVKTKYKTLIYNASNRQCNPILLQNWTEVAGDCGEGITNLNNKLYVRWYLATVSTVDGKEIETPISNDWTLALTNGGYNKISNELGYYKIGNFGFIGSGNKYNINTNKIPTITLPNLANYNNVRLICLATTKSDDFNYSGDPKEIQVKYVYTLRTEQSLKGFAHYEGEAYRYLKEIGYDNQAEKDCGYITNVGGTAAPTWDAEKNDYSTDPDKAVRQNVHTVHYYYYYTDDETNSAKLNLQLPLQFYNYNGQDTEPRAYFRWYDYYTDMASDYVAKQGALLNIESAYRIDNNRSVEPTNVDKNRGLFAIRFFPDPRDSYVGVRFDAQNAFGRDNKDSVVIACDVSRYLDGMDESFRYFVHEPTLSIRYLFHILPAKKLAQEIVDKANANSTTKTGMAAVEEKITSGDKPTILEDEGRIVVSTNKGVGKFSLRTRLSDLGQYYINPDQPQPASSLWWYAYYKDDDDNWWRHLIVNPQTTIEVYENGFNDNNIVKVPRATMYQAKYSLKEDFNDNGSWSQLSGTGGTKPTISVGDRVQIVGCVSTNSSFKSNNNAYPTGIDDVTPIIWAELEFVDAMPMLLGTENKERTATYMKEKYGEPTVLDFNDFSLLGTRKPTHSYENYATVPLRYTNAQYGFCYPQLYGLCATNWYCGWDGYGIDPMHGDYLLLKSMGLTGISANETWEQGIWSNWWYTHNANDNQYSPDPTVLLDVTHEREHPSDKQAPSSPADSEDYGGFLYVDAADEARTIASLEFTDSLCAGAKIYYTAYVASTCGRNSVRGWAQTPPMLRFRVTTKDAKTGESIPVVTFVTGDIKEEINLCQGCYNCKCTDNNDWRNGCTCGNCNHTFKNAHWYQVYGYTTIPAELNYLLNGAPRTYYVEIDNYCDNTDGADYCVDEISFYRSNAKLNVMQSAKKDCNEEGVALNIYVSDKELQSNQMAGEEIYWRICDGNGNPVMDEDLYDDYVEKAQDGTPYGKITVPGSYNKEDLEDASEFTAANGYFKMESDGQVQYYFSLANKRFELTEGIDYHISVFTFGLNPKEFESENEKEEYNENWGKLNNPCSVYSEIFVPKMMYVSVSGLDGDSNPSIKVSCPDHKVVDTEFEILLNIPNDDSGFQSYPGVSFDYYLGTKKDLQDEKFGDGEVKVSLEGVVKYYRNYKESVNENEITWDTQYVGLDPLFEQANPAYYKVLKDSVDAGVLHLACSSKVKLPIDADHATLWAMATAERYEGNLVCTPLPLFFNVIDELEDPFIMLGFKGIDYGNNNRRVVRVGIEQLNKMQDKEDNKGYLLHIPVNSFKAKIETEDNVTGGNEEETEIIAEELTAPKEALGITSGFLKLLANGTDDPAVTRDANVATFEGTVIDEDKMYISFNFHGQDVASQVFREGFTYRMFFQVKNNAKLRDKAACEADVEFLMKVVPKYVTWNGGNSDDWNDDKNWSRSTRNELYKDKYSETENPNPKSNTDKYQDNRDLNVEGDKGFAPMKFTYVTMPALSSGQVAPKLSELMMGSKDVEGENEGIYKNIGEHATDSIEFDLMVRYSLIDEDKQEQCLEHSVAGKVYDCEKFYSNWAKEIYFKSGAELVYQHYLTYEKAWVEKLLKANRWYLMSTPLQNTYAGDMYVPAIAIPDYSSSVPNATEIGKQVTEAFQSIKMTDEEGKLLSIYSRTKYPIYQRSWAQTGSEVYTKTNDVRKNSYSANLSGGVNENFALWSHTYNDVTVNYSKWKGFAIRAHKEGNAFDALIRLPKADTDYSYYQWDGSIPADGGLAKQEVSKPAITIGKFFTDKDEPVNGVTHGVDYGTQGRTAGDGKVEERFDEAQKVGDYLLVGNPYAASLDMQEFFEVNTNLNKAYYIYGYDETAQAYKATTYDENNLGVIRPLQAFFVKVKNNATDKIFFTAKMMTDGNNTKSDNGSRLFALTAANNRGQSTANVSVGDEAKSVATLFDSNLNDVPMVYTVADGQAVSINQVTDLNKPIAFGVTCATNDEPVDVTFSDIAQLTSGEVYVVDAVNGSKQQVTEGVSYSVQPNDYGRYFLTFAGGTTGISEATGIGVVVSVRGRMVTVTSGEMLTEVRAISPDGATVYRDTSGSTTASFTLTPGVYVVKAENAVGEQQTVKVIVK